MIRDHKKEIYELNKKLRDGINGLYKEVIQIFSGVLKRADLRSEGYQNEIKNFTSQIEENVKKFRSSFFKKKSSNQKLQKAKSRDQASKKFRSDNHGLRKGKSQNLYQRRKIRLQSKNNFERSSMIEFKKSFPRSYSHLDKMMKSNPQKITENKLLCRRAVAKT